MEAIAKIGPGEPDPVLTLNLRDALLSGDGAGIEDRMIIVEVPAMTVSSLGGRTGLRLTKMSRSVGRSWRRFIQ